MRNFHAQDAYNPVAEEDGLELEFRRNDNPDVVAHQTAGLVPMESDTEGVNETSVDVDRVVHIEGDPEIGWHVVAAASWAVKSNLDYEHTF